MAYVMIVRVHCDWIILINSIAFKMVVKRHNSYAIRYSQVITLGRRYSVFIQTLSRHFPPFKHGWREHSSTSFSHLRPQKPALHSHLKPSFKSMQCPSFMQGFDEHELISKEKKINQLIAKVKCHI